ncbi:tetratricopeptide repeat protein [Flavobacteriaceae bacterium F08102]|nr:tetratricopeptide repeat protein [Flavobacteriaceae bacterium F08102]
MSYRIIVFLLISSVGYAQNSELANRYFFQGEYDKAAVLYKKLYEENKIRRVYFKQLLSCYQLTNRFDDATALVNSHRATFPDQAYIDIEIGYNLELQGKKNEAIPYYEKALKSVEKIPSSGYLIGGTFTENHLLDYALKTYQLAMELDSTLNYHSYIAVIYGEKAEIENMFNTYLDMIEKNENYFATVQRYVGRFVTEDNQDKHNILFRNLILKRLQRNPIASWNKLLSWLYMQQHEFDKALIQEIALHKRQETDLTRISQLGVIAFNNNDFTTSKKGFTYIIKHTQDPYLILTANLYLLKSDSALATNKKDLEEVNKKFEEILNAYNYNPSTVEIQIAYADFLTFKNDAPTKAADILKGTLNKTTNDLQRGFIKMKLADILVYQNKFNEALINYAQIQTQLKNSTLAQTARFKVAQTSYFKGDFKWALTQLKVLKKSTSQLIANDALELHLLISDNIVGDTIHDALKSYAKADLLAFQNKNQAAVDTLSGLLKRFRGRSIEDESLFKRATLYRKLKQYELAEADYLAIIALNQEDILIDDAYFNLGDLYENHLNDLEKAKEMYQKIIFDFASSIYLVDARKRYRKLRGDVIK